MDLQPTLVGESVLLRPIRAEDFAALHEVASDPLLWAQHPAHDRWQEEAFRLYFDTWFLRGGGLLIAERPTGRTIGASCYSLEGRLPGEVEIGWTFLARGHWGGSTNRKVKALMIRHALRSFERVIFRVAETNLRSRRALEKIGARLTDRTQRALVAGREVVHVVYTIARDDFLASPLALEERG
jgi:RimJ/RimL family protein N-acetyltransferase